ncbi:unnamed protein product [Acanthosepion pharaonis]|uniref:Uncharacterized protein n=1 Tax=Acanthosepion pharaonis TaxID=158019 RepID=A0A812ETI2_ACAPH|nr:unnamed protein product [Sepia pharaonis]
MFFCFAISFIYLFMPATTLFCRILCYFISAQFSFEYLSLSIKGRIYPFLIVIKTFSKSSFIFLFPKIFSYPFLIVIKTFSKSSFIFLFPKIFSYPFLITFSKSSFIFLFPKIFSYPFLIVIKTFSKSSFIFLFPKIFSYPFLIVIKTFSKSSFIFCFPKSILSHCYQDFLLFSSSCFPKYLAIPFSLLSRLSPSLLSSSCFPKYLAVPFSLLSRLSQVFFFFHLPFLSFQNISQNISLSHCYQDFLKSSFIFLFPKIFSYPFLIVIIVIKTSFIFLFPMSKSVAFLNLSSSFFPFSLAFICSFFTWSLLSFVIYSTHYSFNNLYLTFFFLSLFPSFFCFVSFLLFSVFF